MRRSSVIPDSYWSKNTGRRVKHAAACNVWYFDGRLLLGRGGLEARTNRHQLITEPHVLLDDIFEHLHDRDVVFDRRGLAAEVNTEAKVLARDHHHFVLQHDIGFAVLHADCAKLLARLLHVANAQSVRA